MKKRSGTELSISCITVALIFILWFTATAHHWVNEKLVPAPQAVWEAFLEVAKDYKGHSLLQHLGASFVRLFSAFLLSAVTAVPLGLLSGFSKKIRAVFSPVIEFYRPLPPLAYYTLLTLALGIKNESKIALLFLACFAPVYVSCVSAVSKINRDYINGAYTLGCSRIQTFAHVIFPSCMPDIFTGLRTAFGVAYTTLVAAEMVASTSGIGWMVLDAKNWLRSDIIFVGIIVMGITGILFDYLLRLIERKAVPWSGKA